MICLLNVTPSSIHIYRNVTSTMETHVAHWIVDSSVMHLYLFSGSVLTATFPETLKELCFSTTETMVRTFTTPHHCKSYASLVQSVAVICFRIPFSSPCIMGLLLQLDVTLHFWCPPTCLGIAIKAQIPCPHHCWNVVKVLPQVGVVDYPDRVFKQMFPADPHFHLSSSR